MQSSSSNSRPPSEITKLEIHRKYLEGPRPACNAKFRDPWKTDSSAYFTFTHEWVIFIRRILYFCNPVRYQYICCTLNVPNGIVLMSLCKIYNFELGRRAIRLWKQHIDNICNMLTSTWKLVYVNSSRANIIPNLSSFSESAFWLHTKPQERIKLCRCHKRRKQIVYFHPASCIKYQLATNVIKPKFYKLWSWIQIEILNNAKEHFAG
jgi:hypothetical protein